MLKKSFITIIIVLAAGILLQFLLYKADSKNLPEKAVIKYAKSYFMLDNSISEMLCTEIMEDENIVDDYIHSICKEAVSQGFSSTMKKYYLYNISTKILNNDNNNAAIELTCKKRVALNPLYCMVSILFDLGETYKVKHIFNVVKEDGDWKICGDFDALAKS